MCPDLNIAPPDVLIAIASFSVSDWLYPACALLVCIALFALLLWRAPRWACKWLIRRFSAVSILLIAAAFLYSLAGRWDRLLLDWHGRVIFQPGFLLCQLSQLDTEYYRTETASLLLSVIMYALIVLAGIILYRAMRLYRVARASMTHHQES